MITTRLCTYFIHAQIAKKSQTLLFLCPPLITFHFYDLKNFVKVSNDWLLAQSACSCINIQTKRLFYFFLYMAVCFYLHTSRKSLWWKHKEEKVTELEIKQMQHLFRKYMIDFSSNCVSSYMNIFNCGWISECPSFLPKLNDIQRGKTKI